MKVNWNSKYNTITAYSLIVIFSSILFYFFASQIGSYSAKVGYLISIMYPFIIGFVLAYLLNFILKFYEERILVNIKYFNKLKQSKKRLISILLTYLTFGIMIYLCTVGAKVPYEMVRDAKTRGGEDTLISRKRNAVSVAGISYLKAVQATNSPTNAELENGKNWSLVSNGTDTINHKAVPIARIISRG